MKALLFATLFAALSAGALAQGGAKAYAPEDLFKLNEQERTRVITKQYSDLSGGQQIPSDQLEFYLDQAENGWTFSQVSQDIRESLQRGRYRAPPRQTFPQNTPGWQTELPQRGVDVRCESTDGRYQECASGFRNAAIVSNQLSRSQCIEGRNWGHRPGVIWVSEGCRAIFSEGVPLAFGSGSANRVTCESQRSGYRECPVNFRGQATLVEQFSASACFEGQTWGQRPGVIWVDRGCRGTFEEGYRPSGGFYRPEQYTGSAIDCQSINSQYQICNWNDRWGRPQLLEQYSFSPCIEGSTWGFSPRRGIWVDAGCRARFGSLGR